MINYEDKYYEDFSDLVEDLDVESMRTGDIIECEDCSLEPIMKLDADKLLDCTESYWEERTSEDGDEYEKILKVFEDNIDFTKLNSLLPKLWYPNGKEIIFTYEQIIEEYNKNN